MNFACSRLYIPTHMRRKPQVGQAGSEYKENQKDGWTKDYYCAFFAFD